MSGGSALTQGWQLDRLKQSTLIMNHRAIVWLVRTDKGNNDGWPQKNVGRI